MITGIMYALLTANDLTMHMLYLTSILNVCYCAGRHTCFPECQECHDQRLPQALRQVDPRQNTVTVTVTPCNRTQHGLSDIVSEHGEMSYFSYVSSVFSKDTVNSDFKCEQ
jgi:hypothetical protein